MLPFPASLHQISLFSVKSNDTSKKHRKHKIFLKYPVHLYCNYISMSHCNNTYHKDPDYILQCRRYKFLHHWKYCTHCLVHPISQLLVLYYKCMMYIHKKLFSYIYLHQEPVTLSNPLALSSHLYRRNI